MLQNDETRAHIAVAVHTCMGTCAVQGIAKVVCLVGKHQPLQDLGVTSYFSRRRGAIVRAVYRYRTAGKPGCNLVYCHSLWHDARVSQLIFVPTHLLCRQVNLLNIYALATHARTAQATTKTKHSGHGSATVAPDRRRVHSQQSTKMMREINAIVAD
eukprot:UN03895